MRNGIKFLNQVESKTSQFEIVFKSLASFSTQFRVKESLNCYLLFESNRDDTVYLNYLNILESVNTATLTKLRTKIISYFIVIAIKLLDNK